MSQLVRFSVSIPDDLAHEFDTHLHEAGYANRSEAVRDVMRNYLVGRAVADAEAIVMGTVTIVYSHEPTTLCRKLNEAQHECGDSIVCSTHVHLDNHNCLEVIVLRGPSAEIRRMADRLISTKGVKHGQLVCTSVEPHVE